VISGSGDMWKEIPNESNVKPEKKEPVATAFFVFNASPGAGDAVMGINEYTRHILEETLQLLASGMAWEFTPIGIMEQQDQAFGPFETKKEASYMIPSVLDEEGKDWKGQSWTYGQLPMIWDEFIEPNYQVPRYFWCRKCGGTQTFKGSCSTCKSNGEQFVPTIEIKDWNREI
tara:strand:- start:3974 stop:4492 length:519 start_codon:yes stop_codon:yes gene_type:complete